MKAIYKCNEGLGDHIICKGIFNNIPDKYDEINIVVKNDDFKKSLIHLYDPNRVKLLTKSEFVNLYKAGYFDEITEKDCVLSGFQFIGRFSHYRVDWKFTYSKNFVVQMYEQCNVPFSDSWLKFSIDNRNILNEDRLLEKYKNYKIFYHDDPSRGMTIKSSFKESHLNNKNAVFPDNSETNNIFDWIKVIQNCEEIHCIDSCFLNLVDRIETNYETKLYYHTYAKNWEYPLLTKKWTWVTD